MRIFILIGSLNQGGAEYQTLLLAKLFKDRGHQVKLLALTDYSFYKSFIVENQIDYLALSNRVPRWFRVIQAYWYVMLFQPSILLAYTRIVSRVGIFIKRFSFWRLKLLVSERTSLILPEKDKVYFGLLKSANWVTTNSISKLNYINEKFNFLSDRSHFIPNIVNIDNIKVKEKNSFLTNGVNFIYAGRLSNEKNVVEMIKAFAMLNTNYNWSLDIFGSTNSPSYLKEIIETISIYKLEDKIVIKGVKEGLGAIYKDYDCLCLFSKYEGFSNVISEAMAAGIPILCSNIAENAFLVKGNINGILVDITSIESISEKINEFIDIRKADILRIHENNKIKSKELFDLESCYNNYIKLFLS